MNAHGMTTCFEGRRAVVSGGAGGIGGAVARRLLAAGALVTTLDIKPLPETWRAAGGEWRHCVGDLSDEAFVAQALAEASADGKLDYLVNAAGLLLFGEDQSIATLDMTVWRRVIDANLTSAALCARHAVPCMRANGGGAMVHLSSIQALRGDDKPQDAYQAAKAGVIALSKSLAIQFAADAIRSNAVLPGPTESPMQQRWQHDPALKKATAGAVPLGRVGRPQDIASAVIFLLSDQASYITGTELIVDGGLTALP